MQPNWALTLKLLIISDLHDDFWAEANRNPFEGIEEQFGGLDHLLIAGDLSNKPKVRWQFALEKLSRLLPLDRVSLFPGNHDFYDFRLDGEDRLALIAESFGVNYVQKKQITLGSTRLLCATLWTDLALGNGWAANEAHISTKMNDYRYIRVAAKGYRRLTPADMLVRHHDHLSWLDQKLGETFDGQTYVVTHHAPHPSILTCGGGSVAAAYASDLSALLEKHNPARWYFGHSHDAQNAKVGNSQLINVSLGYPEEVADPAARIRDLIFEI